MIDALLGLAIVCAILDWFSVWKKDKKVEAVVKPLAMIFLITWVVLLGQQEKALNTNLIYFVIGLSLCLLGDIFLFLPPEKFFLFGLVSFLLGHIAYIVGFGGHEDISSRSLIPISIFLLCILAIAIQTLSKLIKGIQNQNKERLVIPLVIYAVVISLMLGSAGVRFFDRSWSTGGAYLVAGGALMFFISDVLNAWERFVAKFNHDRLIIMMTYHMGQFGLAIGAALHFTGKLSG